MKVKKRFGIGLIVLCAALVVAAVAFLKNNLIYHGRIYPKTQEILDLTDTSIRYDDYIYLAQQLKNTQIIWNVPLSDGSVPSNQASIQITKLNDDDVRALETFTNLREVDGTQCTDYSEMMTLQQQKPDCIVNYRVTIDGKTYLQNVKEVETPNLNAEQLAMLAYLPQLETVNAAGCTDYQLLLDTTEAHPEWKVLYQVKLGDKLLNENTTTASVENATYEELRQNLYALPKLQELQLVDPDASGKELSSLREQYSPISIHWQTNILGVEATDETTELDLSDVQVDSLSDLEEALDKLPSLEKVIIGECSQSSEDLDAMNRRLENIAVVWTVDLGGLKVRTDETWFMPIKFKVRVRDQDLVDFKYCHDMICIDLGHMDITNCSWAAEMPNLQYLILADTDVLDISPLANHKKLVYLELFLAFVNDLSPLESCTALEDLNLCYTYTDPTPVSHMPWLKRLWWTHNWEAQAMLPDALPNTELHFSSGSSTGEGWREGKRYYEMRDILGMFYMVG